jgi:hypothetical protein
MPICKDRAAKELNDKGYSLVKYPRVNIVPLDVIAGDSSPLDWLGPLTQVWSGGSNPPTSTENNAPNFNYQRSDEFKGSLGVKILQGLIKNIGGVNAGASISANSSLSFTYEAPKQLVISPLTVGAYLKTGDLDSENPVLQRYLQADNATDTHFYVITEVLRARKLLVKVTGVNEADLSADVTALKGIASGNAAVSQKSSKESEIAFDGNVDLTFAFKAYELGYVNGKWTVIGAAPDGSYLAARPEVAQPATLGDRPVILRLPP